jgi:hypothetical protein
MGGSLREAIRTFFRREQIAASLPVSTGIVVHALHKSASMFLFELFRELADQVHVPFHSVHNQPPDHGNIPVDTTDSFILCPVRGFNFEAYSFPSLDRLVRIVQIRDPRDILVSEYYSLGWRHTDSHWSDEERERREAIQKIPIDEFVLTEAYTGKAPLVERMEPLLHADQISGLTIVRYADMIENFPTWIATIVAATGAQPAAPLIELLVNSFENNFSPDEDAGGHKRRVTPGDHRNQLRPETILALNRKFERVLQPFGYLDDSEPY